VGRRAWPVIWRVGFQHAKAERDRPHQQLSALNAALEAFAAAYLGNAVTKPRRKLSAQGRARHCSSSEITLGKGQGAAEGCSNCTSSDARQTKRCQHRLVARSQQRNGRGGQRSSGRRKPPEVDENRSFSEQSKPPQRRHSFETKALERLGERRRVA
jgi:hypothetical protein